jgi:hypothetical protein
MTESTEYQRLIEDYPKLQNQEHREAFDKYVARMWTKPTSFKHYLRAYLEFLTPEKPVFRRLNDLDNNRQQAKPSSQQPGQRRRSGRRSRRSGRQRNKT